MAAAVNLYLAFGFLAINNEPIELGNLVWQFFLPRCSHTWGLAPALEHRAEFPQFLNQGQSVGLLGRVISSSQWYDNRYYYYYGSPALRWALAAFSVSWAYTQSVGLLGRGISPPQGRYLHTEQHKHGINAHITDIHALRGILTHDPSVRASVDSSCLRPRMTIDIHMLNILH
jgi:hypothetical protein